MQYTIRAPMATFQGSMRGQRFRVGVAQAELEDGDVRWFRDRGYRVDPVVSPEASYPELQAEAKELGIPATGKKEELAAAIAAEKAHLAAETRTAGAPAGGEQAGE